MWENNPLAKGWQVVRPYRAAIWLIPVLWDLIKWGVAGRLLGLPFSRWDYTLGFDMAKRSDAWHLHLSMPPSMPTVEQLGLGYSLPPPVTAGFFPLAVVFAMLFCDCLIRAGYLSLVNAALHGVSPTVAGFLRGVWRFGPRFILLALLWMGWTSLTGWLADRGTLPYSGLPTLNMMVLVAMAMAEFVTVTDDVLPPLAMIGGPVLTYANMGSVLSVLALSGVFSVGLTGLASAAGLLYPWLVAPAWGFLGTWLAAGMLAAYQVDVNNGSDPTGRLSWPCRACRVNNHPLADTCVACGRLKVGRQAVGGSPTPSTSD